MVFLRVFNVINRTATTIVHFLTSTSAWTIEIKPKFQCVWLFDVFLICCEWWLWVGLFRLLLFGCCFFLKSQFIHLFRGIHTYTRTHTLTSARTPFSVLDTSIEFVLCCVVLNFMKFHCSYESRLVSIRAFLRWLIRKRWWALTSETNRKLPAFAAAAAATAAAWYFTCVTAISKLFFYCQFHLSVTFQFWSWSLSVCLVPPFFPPNHAVHLIFFSSAFRSLAFLTCIAAFKPLT